MLSITRLARWVTELLAPAILVAVVSPLVAWHAGALGWGLLLTVFAAGTATTLVLVFGPVLLATAPGVALIAWSRVRLGDHTPAQTAVGAGLGLLAAGVIYPLAR